MILWQIFKELAPSGRNRVTPSVKMSSAKALVRVHSFSCSTESMLVTRTAEGRRVRRALSGTLLFKSSQGPVQERSPTNVKNAITLSVDIQVFRPMRESTAERSQADRMLPVKVLTRCHTLTILRESSLERMHTNMKDVGGASGESHIVKLLRQAVQGRSPIYVRSVG